MLLLFEFFMHNIIISYDWRQRATMIGNNWRRQLATTTRNNKQQMRAMG